jgi:Flp pilus assembly protein TadG
MRLCAKLRNIVDQAPGFSRAKRFKKANDGTTAIEFGMVSIPFFMFVFMLAGFALYFFIMNSIDKGVDTVSRQIRTGQAQKASMTVGQFKNAICASAGSWVDCNKTSVFVDKPPSWSNVQTRNCFTPSGALVANTASSNDLIAQYSGTAGQVVLVTICYQWDFAKKVPFINSLPGIDSMTKMQTSLAFRTEPYN